MDLVEQAIAAVKSGDAVRLKRLLEKGVPVGTKQHGVTPLILVAVYYGQLDAARVLLEHGADARGISVYCTPLQAAVERGNTEITGLLLDCGARAEDFVRNYMPRGAQGYYCHAIEYNQPQQVMYLERRGWETFDVAKHGSGMFHTAVFREPRRWESIDFLISRGAEPSRGMWRMPDVYDRLVGAGRTPPEDAPKWEEFEYRATAMTPRHPLWEAREAVSMLGEYKDWQPLRVRGATRRELAAIACFGAGPALLEFYSHLLPASRGAVPFFHGFDDLMFRNGDDFPEVNRRGYFVMGVDGSGDSFSFGPEVKAGCVLPPVVKIDHEIYGDDEAAAGLPGSVEVLEEDGLEFFKWAVKG